MKAILSDFFKFRKFTIALYCSKPLIGSLIDIIKFETASFLLQCLNSEGSILLNPHKSECLRDDELAKVVLSVLSKLTDQKIFITRLLSRAFEQYKVRLEDCINFESILEGLMEKGKIQPYVLKSIEEITLMELVERRKPEGKWEMNGIPDCVATALSYMIFEKKVKSIIGMTQ